MSIDDPEKLRFSAVIGTIWNVVLGWGAVFIGLLGRIMVPAVGSLPDKDPEMIYLVLSSDYFGPVLYGLIIGGIFAAILSTADSQLLVVASTFVRDVYEKIIKKGSMLMESQRLKLSRFVVILSGLLALVMAYLAQDMVFWLVLFAWGGLGASFGTALIFTLYWKKTNKWGIVFGMVTGTLVTITNPTGIYELIPAFIFSSLVIIVCGLVSADTEKQKIENGEQKNQVS